MHAHVQSSTLSAPATVVEVPSPKALQRAQDAKRMIAFGGLWFVLGMAAVIGCAMMSVGAVGIAICVVPVLIGSVDVARGIATLL